LRQYSANIVDQYWPNIGQHCWPMLAQHWPTILANEIGVTNSLDKLRHIRSVAYSVELVVLNKHQI